MRIKSLLFRLLYTLLYYCLIPLLLVRLLLKHQKSRAYKEQRQDLRLKERLGLFSVPFLDGKVIWLHTVSVGEFLATMPLIKKLQTQFPHHILVITCTTTTASAQITTVFANAIRLGQIFHVYLPYDVPNAVNRFLQKINPCIGLIMETEIWPNLLYCCQRYDIPMWLLNARMSTGSAKGYTRFATLSQSTLQRFSGISAQHSTDAHHFITLGANKKTLHISGSIKFDLSVDRDDLIAGNSLRKQLHWQNKTVLIAVSTHQGEEKILLEVYFNLKTQYPNLVMIIVPRHPERFQSVYQLLQKSTANIVKRSMIKGTSYVDIDILLGDSMGEMMCYLACADIVFMGGTLQPIGGHNILEPAILEKTIVTGPYMFNFAAINELFLAHNASQQVNDIHALEKVLIQLLSNPEQAQTMAFNAKHLLSQHSGAVDKMLTLITADISL
jgi:3-deoxy-D-manno-octulosonic-acid transferase